MKPRIDFIKPSGAALKAMYALEAMLRVRRVALDGFSRGVLPPDRQTGELEERAVLLHLLHGGEGGDARDEGGQHEGRRLRRRRRH